MKLTALFLFFAAPAVANSIIEHTAVNGLRVAKKESLADHREHGGMIFLLETEFGPIVQYLEPRDGGDRTAVRVIDKSKLPPGAVMVGTYHVHICMNGYYHEVFSKTDLIVAVISGVPEFMLDECTGLIHEFDTKLDRVRDTGIDANIVGSHGESVHIHLPSGRVIEDIGETETAI